MTPLPITQENLDVPIDADKALAWFEGLALWKAAVFCEAIYGRYVRGELGAEDGRAARFEQGVPYLAESAAAAISR